MKLKGKIVIVEAVDWANVAEQVDIGHDFEAVRAVVVGMVVKETDDALSLTQQWFDIDDVRATMTIPKCAIVRRRDYDNPFDGGITINHG